jgi:hypothetical protein
MPGCPPIADRCNLQHVVLAIQTLKTVVDHLPDAVNCGMNLALAFVPGMDGPYKYEIKS